MPICLSFPFSFRAKGAWRIELGELNFKNWGTGLASEFISFNQISLTETLRISFELAHIFLCPS